MAGQDQRGTDRRGFLRTAGLAGAGAAALGTMGTGVASAATTDATAGAAAPAGTGSGRWNPDPDRLQFTLAVMPDTQFLYWGEQGSVSPAPQEASFRWIIEQSGDASGDNIVFLAHLGDLTEDGATSSFQHVDPVFKILDQHGSPTACWPETTT